VKRLLLISSSKVHGTGYLEHCEEALRRHLAGVRRLTFVPYALRDRDGYAGRARARFAELGIELDSVHHVAEPARTIESAEAVFIGGGNTFRLLEALWEERLIEPLRARVESGMAYAGASAGSNVACPTLKTTNDMPIVEPRTFEALGLVPFQINPHFIDADPLSTHAGETRETRLAEFHEENATPVVGLREGAWLVVEDRAVTLGGTRGAKLFRRGRAPLELTSGARIDSLLP
jgi:dipeptidase E